MSARPPLVWPRTRGTQPRLHHSAQRFRTTHGRPSTYRRTRFGISAGQAIKNQNLAGGVDNQEISLRIDVRLSRRFGGQVSADANLRIGPAQNPFRRHVAVGFAVENQDVAREGRNEDLVVIGIDAHHIRYTQNLGMWSLDDTNGRFLTIGRSTECQDGLGKGTRRYEFVMNRVIRKSMDGSADQRLLALDRSDRRRV